MNLTADVIERTLPTNSAPASSALPGQARLCASIPPVAHSNRRLTMHLQEQENLKRGVREGGDGRDPTLKNMGADACCELCLQQNSKIIAQRTRIPPQEEEQWRCTCAHPERGEAVEGQRLRRR